jgi:uncharacterized protein (DUF2141 family)
MKKHIIIIFSVMIFSIIRINPALSQNYTLTIKAIGIHSLTGNILIGIYNNADVFPKEGHTYTNAMVKITATEMSYSVSLPAGTYAVALFHDENTDFELNTNWFGVPVEGYGFSNNATGTFGPASYDDAKFTLSKDTSISITIDY